jgi:hypothetical protein
MIDINSEGKYNEEEVAEKQLVAPEDTPRLGREESIAEDWKIKAEIRLVQGDGLDDAKEAIKNNEENVVRQDFACKNSKAKNKELDLLAGKSFGEKGIDDDNEEEVETKVGTSAEEEKPLADNTCNTDRPSIVEGDVKGENDQGQANIFRHVRDQRDDEKRAIDKADEEDGKMILVRKKIRKIGRKMMRMMHKHLEDAKK